MTACDNCSPSPSPSPSLALQEEPLALGAEAIKEWTSGRAIADIPARTLAVSRQFFLTLQALQTGFHPIVSSFVSDWAGNHGVISSLESQLSIAQRANSPMQHAVKKELERMIKYRFAFDAQLLDPRECLCVCACVKWGATSKLTSGTHFSF